MKTSGANTRRQTAPVKIKVKMLASHPNLQLQTPSKYDLQNEEQRDDPKRKPKIKPGLRTTFREEFECG